MSIDFAVGHVKLQKARKKSIVETVSTRCIGQKQQSNICSNIVVEKIRDRSTKMKNRTSNFLGDLLPSYHYTSVDASGIYLSGKPDIMSRNTTTRHQSSNAKD